VFTSRPKKIVCYVLVTKVSQMTELEQNMQAVLTEIRSQLKEQRRVRSTAQTIQEELKKLRHVDEVLRREDGVSPKLPKYSWAGSVKVVYWLRVIDGDTIEVALLDRNRIANGQRNASEILEGVVTVSLRLYGIDCAEKRPYLSNPNREAIKALADKASDSLSKILANNRFLQAYFMGNDKFGRPMAILTHFEGLYCTYSSMSNAWDASFNRKLIEDGLALPYVGGSRWTFLDASSHFQMQQGAQKSRSLSEDSWWRRVWRSVKKRTSR